MLKVEQIGPALSPLQFKIGHAFLTFSQFGTSDITIGYNPIVHGTYGLGIVRDDSQSEVIYNGQGSPTLSEHPYSSSKTYDVTAKQFNDMLAYAAGIANDVTDRCNGYPAVLGAISVLPTILGSESNKGFSRALHR